MHPGLCKYRNCIIRYGRSLVFCNYNGGSTIASDKRETTSYSTRFSIVFYNQFELNYSMHLVGRVHVCTLLSVICFKSKQHVDCMVGFLLNVVLVITRFNWWWVFSVYVPLNKLYTTLKCLIGDQRSNWSSTVSFYSRNNINSSSL